jgi:anti-anti-sigma regulatory factor
MDTNIKVKKTKTKNTITVEKEFAIFNVKDVKGNIDEALEQNKKLVLDMKDMDNLDLTAIQLILALKEKAKDYKKGIEINISLTEQMNQILINSGFNQELLEHK